MKRDEIETKIIYWLADEIGLEMFDKSATRLLDMLLEAGMKLGEDDEI